jgi:hypothetical protein
MSMQEIDGLLILAAVLMGVTLFSAIRALYARHVLPFQIHRTVKPVETKLPLRKAA